MKKRSLPCALVAMTLVSFALIGCANVSPAPQASQRIYQPRVLLLKAGQPVATPTGIYVPQTDELWHSARAFEQLENENLNLAAALTHERNRK